jgi:ribonuclease-3 family protein
MNLEELVLPEIDPINLKPESLAYIGDLILKMVFLKKSLNKVSKAIQLHKDGVFYNNRGYQSKLLKSIEKNLTEDEMWIVRRAKNSKAANRFGSDIDYKMATGLEALIGYLFLKKDFDRIHYLLHLKDSFNQIKI